MENYTLIFISANDCGACQGFKQIWPKIKEILSKEIEIEEINLTERRQAGNPKNFKDPSLMRYIGWFPTFFLKSDTKVEIFNGEMVNGQPENKEKYHRSVDGFKRWISDVKENDLKTLEYKKQLEQESLVSVSETTDETTEESKNDVPLEIPKKKKLVSSIRGPSFEISGDR